MNLKHKINNYKNIFLSLLVVFLFSGKASLAQETVTILGKKITTDSLDGFMQIAIAVADFIFGITGSLALLMFVYGGFMFLISAGSTENVTKGKQIITGAVIGIAIIFTSYIIVGFVFKALAVNVNGSSWSNIGWFK